MLRFFALSSMIMLFIGCAASHPLSLHDYDDIKNCPSLGTEVTDNGKPHIIIGYKKQGQPMVTDNRYVGEKNCDGATIIVEPKK